ncbi:MAG: type II toxin-antitoxin system Phd/YefM family antitoxin [Gemmatimonadota bacterium]
MRRAPISELKAKLSQYLDAVRAGQEVIVTDRGRPVARISPVRGEAGSEGRMERLVRTGQVRPPTEPMPPDLSELSRPADPGGRSLEVLLADRAAGR